MNNVEQIKSKLDIVELIQEYLPLKQAGTNFKGLCPFHNEKTPSFMVSRDKQFFKCFGCGEGGDIFTFLQKIENIEFPEALKILADKAGVILEHKTYQPETENLKTRLYYLMEQAISFYERTLTLPAGTTAARYLVHTRKMKPETIKEFRLGYAPDQWEALGQFLKSRGFNETEIHQSGLVVDRTTPAQYGGLNYYDRFRDRITFPIFNPHGSPVGLTARAMKKEEAAKYINTPQTIIYNKSQVLYGLDKAKNFIRKENLAVLVEGNMDVIASFQAGVKNVVCSSGTALTAEQINLIKRYTNNVALCFDADSAGQNAAERGVGLMWQLGMNVKVVLLPVGIKDPDELISKDPKNWAQLITERVNFMDYLLATLMRNKNLNEIDTKNSITNKALGWLVQLINPVEQDHYLKILSQKLQINENALQESIKKIKRGNINNASQVNWEKKSNSHAPLNKLLIMSERLLSLLIAQNDYLKTTIDRLAPEMLSEHSRDFYKELIFWYTKNNNFLKDEFYQYLKNEKPILVSFFDTLNLLAENEWENLTPVELNKEFKLTFNFIKKENIIEHLKQLEKELRQVEEHGERDRADNLIMEFSRLSQELAEL